MYSFVSINQSTLNLTVSLNDFAHLLFLVSILFTLEPCHAPMLNKNHFKLPRAFESRLYQVCQGFISLTETYTPNPTPPTLILDCVPKPLMLKWNKLKFQVKTIFLPFLNKQLFSEDNYVLVTNQSPLYFECVKT